jgi:putative hydrolase of the HAD superfamily
VLKSVDTKNRKEQADHVIEWVAFDLDGVVIPNSPNYRFFTTEFDVTRAAFSDFFYGPFQDCLVGKTDLFDVLPAALDSWGWKGTMEQFMSRWMESSSNPDSEVIGMIKDLLAAGVKCCVASNQDNRRASHLRTLPWIQNLFIKQFYSYALGVAKPGCGYFRLIEDDCAVAGEAILFVDDKAENVDAARSCGWHAEVCQSASDLRMILTRHCPAIFARAAEDRCLAGNDTSESL